MTVKQKSAHIRLHSPIIGSETDKHDTDHNVYYRKNYGSDFQTDYKTTFLNRSLF